MGTNYYLYEKPACPHCEREYEALHIGKSSGGWCFSLHVMPDIGINDLPDWEKKWNQAEAIIKNEYGKQISISEMLEIIKDRFLDQDHNLSKEWLYDNHAEKGPNNLARSKIDGVHCVGHGKGTWDLIIGEFS